jgi:hypothetical protein
MTLTTARRSDPDTSHDAAASTDTFGSRADVLHILFHGGALADHELVAKLDWFTPSRVRTARHELTEQGLVEATGYYRLTPSGRRAIVWQVVR